MADNKIFYWAVGRRKTSVARVRLSPGKGSIIINGKPLDIYFRGCDTLKASVLSPLRLTNNADGFDVFVNVNGGGITGQADAIRHGISRALLKIDTSLRPVLKSAGFLTRDSRKVERKKPGRPKARKRFQYSKR